MANDLIAIDCPDCVKEARIVLLTNISVGYYYSLQVQTIFRNSGTGYYKTLGAAKAAFAKVYGKAKWIQEASNDHKDS